MTKQKLAIFDLDGTLYNTNEVNFGAYRQAMAEKGYRLEHDFYCDFCNGKHYKVFFPALGIKKEDWEPIHQRKVDLYAMYLKAAKENTSLFNIIESIRNEYYIALVTTASSQNCQDILTAFNRKELFNLILTHADITKPKPDPDGFLKAMDYFSIASDSTMIFEDSAEGIAAAEATGAVVYAVRKF